LTDDGDFFRGATLKICGSLEIEDAMSRFVRYVKRFIPADRMLMLVYEPCR
jgi:hypothetical protein